MSARREAERVAAYWRKEYDEANQEREALRWKLTCAKSALENWGRHHAWCVKRQADGACTCGYEAAIHDAEPSVVAAGGTDGR